MKKFLFLIISILSLSFLFNTNNANAQEFPNKLIKSDSINTFRQPDNDYTHEFLVDYRVFGDYTTITEDDIVFTTYYTSLRKGLDRNTNSFTLEDVIYFGTSGYTRITLRITLLKSFIDNYYSLDPSSPDYYIWFFLRDSALYVSFTERDYETGYNEGYETGYSVGEENGFNRGYEAGRNAGYNDGYNRGYNSGYNQGYFNGIGEGFNLGYNDGYNTGYNIGYTNGINATQEDVYKRGYNDGLKSALGSFTNNFHVWFVPAIILVFAIGIFVTYRRGRDV